MIEDKIGEVSSKVFWKELQSENAVQTAVMWDSIFCVTRLPPTMMRLLFYGEVQYPVPDPDTKEQLRIDPVTNLERGT